MGRDWKKWAQDKGLMKWFQKDNLIILVLAGILLVIIALPTKSGSREQENSGSSTGKAQNTGNTGNTENTGNVGKEGNTETSGMPPLYVRSAEGGETGSGALSSGGTGDTDREYACYLEEKLTDTLSQMAGVGKVRVMITLQSSRELVVEKEEPVSRSTTNENDSQGGSRIVSQMESGESTVYSKSGNSSEPYVIMILPPRIEGVLVVAEGAGSGTVNRTIVEIVQALFGVEAHKVRVVPMNAD